MAHISERADAFVRKITPEKPPPDNRTTDEKLAEFAREWGHGVKEAKAKLKRRRNGK